jgi:hypothetical protein
MYTVRDFILHFRPRTGERAQVLLGALVQIAEFGRVHWSFGELRTSDEQAEPHRKVVCRAAL